MYNEEEVEGDVAAVGFGGEEEVGFGEAEVRVDEGAGFEFEGAPVDACGDLRWESVDEEGGGCGWVGEAGTEETVVGVEGVLVGHGGARRIGWWDAVASENAQNQQLRESRTRQGNRGRGMRVRRGSEVAGDKVEAGGYGVWMRWVLMVFVMLAAVMGGEVGAVVVMGRLVARSDYGDRQAVFSGGTSVAEYTVPSATTVQHVRGHDLGGGTKGLHNEGVRH
jgi:hypothetical protein